ncbi:MAG: ABC transporter permease [Dethiosulfovibrio peptidovorans]|nr:MAG: ABC transporter permease [Dethiosulfovibrio peptidovorans]
MGNRVGSRKKMYLKMVLSSLIRRSSRLMVAILAIAIGATILSGLVTIYYDIPRQLGREFRSYGANLILLPEGDRKISRADIEKVKKIIGEGQIVGMAPYRYQTVKINEQPYIMAGTDLAQAKENSPFWFVEGEWGTKATPDQVMVGREIARTLNLTLGDPFVVKGVKYGEQAVASKQTFSAEENIQKDIGAQYFSKKLFVKGIVTTGGAEEGFIFVDIGMLDTLVGDSFKSDVVECSVVADAAKLKSITKQVAAELPGIQPRAVRRLTQSQDIVLGKLQALVYLVTIVVLIITMVSVSTTMMAMVAERKKEIGLKKALGADNCLIIREFLGEGVFLGCIGGLIGVALGFEFAQRVSLSVFGRAINFQWSLVPITITVFIVITIVASILPVRRVMDIHPAIVLRGE